MNRKIKITYLQDHIIDESFTIPKDTIYYMTERFPELGLQDLDFRLNTEKGKYHFTTEDLVNQGIIKQELQ